jgi:hypothetical protein
VNIDENKNVVHIRVPLHNGSRLLVGDSLAVVGQLPILSGPYWAKTERSINQLGNMEDADSVEFLDWFIYSINETSVFRLFDDLEKK